MSSLTITTGVSTSGSNGLDVKDHGRAISVPQEIDTTNLVWQLTGTAAQGSFNAIDDPNYPGFSWVTADHGSAFGQPIRSTDGKQITMADSNNSNSTAGGPWIYKLCATVDGQQYSTVASISPTQTTTNPTIQNQ